MQRLFGSLLFLTGLLAVAAATWWLLRSEPEAPEGPGRPPFVLPVVVTEVERGDLEPQVALTGTVRARRSAMLGFEASGRVATTEVDEGDRVKKGALLATLTREDSALRVESALAGLELAKSELQHLEAGARVEEKERLRAEFDAAQAEAQLGELDLNRGKELLAERVVSQAEVDRRQAVYTAARRRAEAAHERLNEAEAGTRVEEIEIARARVAVAEATLDVARREVEKTQLLAPWNGAVVRRFVSSGAYVNAGQPIYEILLLDELEIVLEVPGREAARLAPGARVRVTVDTQPGFFLDTQLDTRIPGVDDLSGNARTIVRLGPDRGDGDVLEPGQFVRADVFLEPVLDALIVPADAVRTTDAGTIVVRAVEASAMDAPVGAETETPVGAGPGVSAEWVPVRVLATAGTKAAVESAELAKGDRVVLTGVDLAFPGAPLLVRELVRGGAQEGTDTPGGGSR